MSSKSVTSSDNETTGILFSKDDPDTTKTKSKKSDSVFQVITQDPPEEDPIVDQLDEVVQEIQRDPNPVQQRSRLERALNALGYYDKTSKKFEVKVTLIIIAILAAIAIGLTVHYVGSDKILNWFQGDFKNSIVTWFTDHATPLEYTALMVGSLGLGFLIAKYGPGLVTRIKTRLGVSNEEIPVILK